MTTNAAFQRLGLVELSTFLQINTILIMLFQSSRRKLATKILKFMLQRSQTNRDIYIITTFSFTGPKREYMALLLLLPHHLIWQSNLLSYGTFNIENLNLTYHYQLPTITQQQRIKKPQLS